MTESERSQPLQIGLVGTFDIENYGDCLFPELYVHLIRQHLPDASFTLYSPFARAAEICSFDQVKALPAVAAEAEFREDCLIQTGGETVSLGHSSGSYIMPSSTWSHYLRMWLGPTIAASRSNTKFIVHCAGMPQHSVEADRLIGIALQSADKVTMRDPVSVGRLGGGFPVEIDPVFLLADLLPHDEWNARACSHLPVGLEPGNYIAVQASHGYVLDDLDVWCAQIAQVLESSSKQALLLPVCHFLEDWQFLNMAKGHLSKLYPHLAARLHSLPRDQQNVKDTAALISRSAGYVGTSLHGAVTAAAFALPMAVFGGQGRAEGKHAQTLLAAGIDTGTFYRLDELAECFARSCASDLAGNCARARLLATEGVDSLIKEILSGSRANAPIAEDCISRIEQLDRENIRSLKLRLKRQILASLRPMTQVHGAYRNLKLKHKFSK